MDLAVTAGISATLGAISGLAVHSVGGSLKQSIRDAVFGAETGIVIGLAVADGEWPDVIAAGLVGGFGNFLLSAIGDSIRDSQGKQPIGGPPSKAKYLDAFLMGFDISANQEFIAPDSILGDTIISGLMGGVGDVFADWMAGDPIDWKAAIRDTVTTAAIGVIVNSRTVGFLKPNQEMAQEVAKWFSTTTGTAIAAEISLLVQAYLP